MQLEPQVNEDFAWEEMQKLLQEKKKRRFGFWWWFFGGLLLIGMASGPYFLNTNNAKAKIENTITQNHVSNTNTISKTNSNVEKKNIENNTTIVESNNNLTNGDDKLVSKNTMSNSKTENNLLSENNSTQLNNNKDLEKGDEIKNNSTKILSTTSKKITVKTNIKKDININKNLGYSSKSKKGIVKNDFTKRKNKKQWFFIDCCRTNSERIQSPEFSFERKFVTSSNCLGNPESFIYQVNMRNLLMASEKNRW